MSAIELQREIYHSIRQNRMRTVMSGFGISWGILILVVLLGTGRGFQDSIMSMFSVFARKSIIVHGNATSQKYRNIKEGKSISFDEPYLNLLHSRYPEIAAISPEKSSSQLVRHDTRSGVFNIVGVGTDYMHIRILSISDGGRLFNPSDSVRNVAIIGRNAESSLFGNKVALNKFVDIGGTFYRVVGVLKNDDIFSQAEINSVYIPFASFIRNINSNIEFRTFCLYLNPDADSGRFENNLRNYLAHHSSFSSNDKQAVYIANFEKQTNAFESLFKGIRMFIWGVGICFLISGIVGISNIMFVVVKERTNEIGIRLAVGALPRSIISLVLLESVVITTISGLIGLVAGKGILLFIDWLLSFSGKDVILQKTSLDVTTAAVALVILILSGVVAGAFPAIKASTVEPVDAIRYENRG
ncbi:MAG: ABC transporter permease [Dysgonamonadaceae bacterium]|jgi:putative ABC transport system permease protein|nr:ABC transporter permease [Dysgonamonadaceae bacterium]